MSFQNAQWRVPSLRNVARTAPHFHNGSVDDLAEAVRVMAQTQLGLAIVTDGENDRLGSASKQTVNEDAIEVILSCQSS